MISKSMDDPKTANSFLDVPYYRQTRTATCGPACLMMAMKYWEPAFEFSRHIEFQLWLESFSFFLFGGTFQYGLATAAKKRGFKPEIFQKGHFSAYYPSYPRAMGLMESIISRRARVQKIPIHYDSEVLKVILESLEKKIPPIVFVNLKPILGENVFHWVVVTGVDTKNVYVNDPYVPLRFPGDKKKDFPVPLAVFQHAIATETGRNLRLPPCAVVLSQDKRQPF
jgi:hypothetical protein